MARKRYKPELGGFLEWLRSPFEKPQAPPPERPTLGIDYYALLGVSPGASTDEIRSAFRRLGAIYHPDRNPGDSVSFDKFKEISKAHDILSNPDTRSAYDSFLASMPKPFYPVPYVKPEEQRVPKSPREETPSKRAPETPLWKVMFGPPSEEKEEPAADIFASVKKSGEGASSFWGESSPGVFDESVDLPIDDDIKTALQTWPLDWVAEVAHAERSAPEFRRAGGVIIDAIAGKSGAPEEDLSELFDIDFQEIDEYARARGRDALWKEVLDPFLKRVGEVLTSIKPKDLPGRFIFEMDPQSELVNLIYEERVARTWK